MALDKEIYKEFEDVVGPDNISDDAALLDTYITPMAQSQHHMGPAYHTFTPRGLAVVMPASTEEVQGVVKICNKHKIRFKASSTFWMVMGYPAEDPPTRPRYPLDYVLFEDEYPALSEERIEQAMEIMDKGYLDQDYYREGKLMIDAARRYSRIVSGGSQRVLGDYRKTVDPCWNGDKGIIKSINVNVGPLPIDCNKKGEPVPAGFDWDMWLGPAPWAPYHPHRCSGSYSINGESWRSFRDYSGGGMTDWGAHHFGGATFAIDVRELEPEEVIFHSEDGKKFASCRYPNGKLVHHGYPDRGNLEVEGTDEKGPSKPVPGYAGTGGIYGDFIDCVKTHRRPFRDIEYAVHTTTVCHLFLIAYELERSLKWDTVRQQFIDDDEANRLVDVARREPWVI